MKLFLLELCLLSLASHGQLQVSTPTVSPASSLRAEIENLRKFLDEALQAIDNGTVAALDQGTLVSILTQYTQNLMEKHVTEEETAATTEASVTEEEISTPSVDVNSDSTIDDVTETVNENEETTSPVYTTTTTQEQSTRDEICELPPMTGMCRGYFLKFHFDPIKRLCTKFVYGGCGGNANRFNSEEECKKRCQP
ncbi:amyloid-beta A4 protein-like [Pomacea canaliculata]|nr:amyloid-beta A4 protein-like [Pomacea canaliculata]